MRILLVSFMVPEAPSGVSVHYKNLAKSLRHAGYQAETRSIADAPASIKFITGGFIKVLSLFGNLGKEIGREVTNFIRVYAAVQAALRNQTYDLINAQDVGSACAARLAARGRIPVLLTCHFNDDPATENIKRRKLTGLAAAFSRKWHTYLFSGIGYYNGVSAYVIKKSRHLFKQNAWVEIIYNGVDFPKSKRASPLTFLQDNHPGKKIIMNIGHLEKRKNQRLIVDIAYMMKRKRKDFVFAIVGEGEDYAYLEEQIRKDNLSDHVVLLGRHENVIPLLKSADLYLHTALNENCPLVLLEAIAAGVPAFALSVGGIPEILRQQEALFPPDSSAKALSDVLGTLLDNPFNRDMVRSQQYAYGSQEFDIHTMTQKYIAYYQKVTENFAQRQAKASQEHPSSVRNDTYNPVDK